MRKLLVLLALVSACRTASTPAPSTQPSGGPGAATPRAAVEAFLQAIRSEDLQAMGAIWGTADGPARELMDRETLEKREIVMVCMLRHDSYAVRGDSPLAGGRRAFTVELTRGTDKRTTTFTAVQGRQARWFVLQADLEPVGSWCQRK